MIIILFFSVLGIVNYHNKGYASLFYIIITIALYYLQIKRNTEPLYYYAGSAYTNRYELAEDVLIKRLFIAGGNTADKKTKTIGFSQTPSGWRARGSFPGSCFRSLSLPGSPGQGSPGPLPR